MLISETRGGAVRHQEVRDSEGRADGLALHSLALAQIYERIRFNTRNSNFLEISLTFRG